MTTSAKGFLGALILMAPFAGYLTRESVAAATPGTPIVARDISGRTICATNGTKITFFKNGAVSTNNMGTGSWSVDEYRHVIINFPNQHLNIAVNKERTPKGIVFHYHRWGGDEAIGDGVYCQ